MTALNPALADRILTAPAAPFSTLAFGDVDLVPSSAPHAVATVGGFDAIPRTGDDSFIISDDTFAPATGNWAFFIAIAGPATDEFGWEVVTASPAGTLNVSVEQVVAASTGTSLGSDIDLAVPHDAGITVYGIVGNSSESLLANSRQGMIATAAAAPSPSADNFVLGLTGGDSSLAVLGAWLFESEAVTAQDLIDTINAIGDDFGLDPVALTYAAHASSSWHIVGSAAGTSGDLPAPPVPTAPAPGGSQTPPAKPTPPTPSEMTAAGVYPIMHVWETLPEASWSTIRAGGWVPTSYGATELGYLQIVVEGVDITMYGGIETPFPSWKRGEPFGSQSATIQLPQLTTFHTPPAWAKHGANVSIDLVKIAGGTVSLFDGFVMDLGLNEDAGVFTLECLGVLFGADLTLRPPSFTTAPKDIGNLIPALLNAVSSRRWLTMTKQVTGIRTAVAGGWEPLLTGYIQELLATAVKDGRQWTVTCDNRTPALERKDTTTIAWTVRAGQRGIGVDLNSDASQSPNVIYGEGVASDGGRWRNAKYPNWKPDDTPDYPNTNPADTMYAGRTDASTDSGDGVSTFERKLGLKADGYYSQSDRQAVMRAQRRLGITVDGIVGPQTWAAIFDTGANTGSLDGAFVAPLAYADEVEPRLIGPDGDDLGANPNFDGDIPRVERKINYGQGVSKSEGIVNAEEVLVRDINPGWQGVVTFELDPSTKSKYELREGENGRILGWRGEDIDVHVALARYDVDLVTLEVDTQARDYPTLQAIRTRDRDAIDPAKVAAKRILDGEVQTDRATFDAESPAGRMPKHAIFTNLWDVRRMPMGSYGRVVRTEFTTSGSARPFALAVFGKPLTAADLLDVVGNPLTSTTNPWNTDDLEDFGFLQAWGWKEQPAGYYPNTYSDPTGNSGASVTGKLVDDASWDYASEQSPWLWVAAIADAACFIEGRFFGSAD